MERLSHLDLFFCACCERELARDRLSSARLLTPSRVQRLLCVQCEGFLSIGLPFLVDKVRSQKLQMVTSPAAECDLTSTSTTKASSRRGARPATGQTRRPAKRENRPRQASALERESFNYRALTLELYIEGFIKGLEAAGLDRHQLTREAETAVNNLLNISQTLSGQRMQVTADTHNRADLRRMARHVDETALMVEEYIQAVTEACSETPTGRN
jgi:hypothetical protein